MYSSFTNYLVTVRINSGWRNLYGLYIWVEEIIFARPSDDYYYFSKGIIKMIHIFSNRNTYRGN
jgi:hypothetical protein